MKIGYVGTNKRLGCKPDSSFRLASFSEDLFIDRVEDNLACLLKTLRFNVVHGLFFYRISSGIIPFGSHPILEFDWKTYFKEEFEEIANFIKEHEIRISMHPDQFVVLNAKNEDIVQRSISELEYHADLLDCLQLDTTAKIQIHVGGAYGDKSASMERFARQYAALPGKIKRRLCIENDEKLFNAQDCTHLHKHTGAPIVFDVLHHEIFHSGESVAEALSTASKTWWIEDGIPMVDYSSQQEGERVGKHASSLHRGHFLRFLESRKGVECDIMIEIKDKEESALKALEIARLAHMA